ncbi:Nitrogen regulation protein NR(I) [hydrothermal vent metagenome]|uniref:Nitrogen regulation protein NR(I) n=1 Tax=hydrothermal vent metagenome TaxID=652676 RepID=A0A3B0WJ64_9ZZZZ
MDTCKVYIIDDAEEVRSAITLLMESVGLDVVAFNSADDFLSNYRTDFEGCILLDVRMPGMSGLDLQEKLNEMGDAPPVIIISGHGDIPMAVKAVQAGAINFVEKPFNEQELLDSVHRAFKVDSLQRGKNVKVGVIKEKINTLTKRENEVLYAITAGKRNKVIAADLNISLSTVEAHRGHVMQKMEAKSLSDLMRMVIYVENEAVDAIE